MTSGVPLLQYTRAQLFITYSSLLLAVYTNLFVIKYYLSPFQKPLSLSLIIQRNLDHLLRTTDRHSLASLHTSIRYPCVSSGITGSLILYESKNVILGVERKT